MHIPNLEDLSFRTRVVIALVIIIVAFIILIVAGSAQSPESPDTKNYCVTDEEARERIRGFMFDSLDQALQAHFQNLFSVWMKDHRSQPDRARVGVMQGIAAHQTARRLASEWIPPVCQQDRK